MAEDPDQDKLDEIVNRGPVGTFAVAGLATAIVVLIFFAFYLLVYLPRGTIQCTATDVIHGFVVGKTNANVMLIPGYVATFTATFPKAGDQLMPCHEYCGPGHAAMWAQVQVLACEEFLAKSRSGERMSCV